MEKLKSLHFCAFLDVNFKGFDSGKEAAPDLNLQNLYKDFLGKDKDKEEGEANVGPRAVPRQSRSGARASTSKSTPPSRRCCSTASRAPPTRKATSRTASSPSMNSSPTSTRNSRTSFASY